MAPTAIEIALRVTALSPFSVGAGGNAGTLLNKTILRDGRDRPIIPASQVKGKARHSAEALLLGLGLGQQVTLHQDQRGSDAERDATLIGRIFGTATQRSPLRFADLTASLTPSADEAGDAVRLEPQLYSTARPSVSLNRRRGSAEEARLLFQEVSHEQLVFVEPKAITGTLERLEEAALLWAALRLIHSWGGAKTRGLGWGQLDLTLRWGGEVQDAGTLEQALRGLLNTRTGR
ncbi:MAG TPA: RAMP superfamily CRISPR-associated protein [Roseiflexaceae bacterium]|nr:RAMP superfamily CRISPR-associated protein [Roseiflexaceae bacterium]